MLVALPLHAQVEGGLPDGTPAPAVQITDLDGRLVDLGASIGQRPLVLEFWATWCTVCAALMPTMERARQAYGDQVRFVGVNITVGERPEAVRAWVERHRPPFEVLYDSSGAAVRAYDVQSTSTVVIIDRAGRVAYTGVGATQDIPAVLARVLAADPDPRSPSP